MQDPKETKVKSPAAKNEPSTNEKDREEQVTDGQYYYDDAHGYEEFDPDSTDEDDDK